MNTEALILFLILLLGIVLCSFLGTNWNSKEGLTNNSDVVQTVTFHMLPLNSSNSQIANVSYPNGTNSTMMFNLNGNSTTYTLTSSPTSSSQPYTYNGSDGSTAELFVNPNQSQQGTNENEQILIISNSGVITPYGSTSSYFPQSTTNTNTSSTSSTNNNYDNYNHYASSTSQAIYGTFYGPNGGTATIVTNSDGTKQILVVNPGTSTPIIYTIPPQSILNTLSGVTANTYYAPNGSSATIVTNNGQTVVQVTTPNSTTTYTQNGAYYNPNNTSTSTQYYGSTGYPIQQSPYALAYQGPYGGSATSVQGAYGGSAGAVTGPNGNTAYYAQGPNGNTVAGTTNNGYGTDYYSTLPPGIPASQIPPGQEDLYILKSEIVPPVCPACPVAAACPSTKEQKCPPCPACSRCPEPSFECKKVPNYNSIENDYLPQPVLNDFSTFGM